MKLLKFIFIFIIIMVGVSGCSAKEPSLPDLSQVDMINNVEGDLIIQKLTESIWVYSAYSENTSENGLITVDETASSIIDPPATEDLTERLGVLVEEYFGKPIGQVLWTKSIEKNDSVLQYYRNQNADIFAADRIALGLGIEEITPFDTLGTDFEFGGYVWRAYVPTNLKLTSQVNAALWLESEKILYAGVNVVATEFEGITAPVYETSDWRQMLDHLNTFAAGVQSIVPKVGSTGGAELLTHTQNLILEREFTLNNDDQKMFLRSWLERSDVESILGKTINFEERILGEGSDTFTGSKVQVLTFPMTEVTLFSPPNGQLFWLSTVATHDPKILTARGIKTGDTLDALNDSYPEITAIPDGRTDPQNRDYIYDHDTAGEYALIFEVSGGKVKQLKIEYTLR